MIGNKTTIPLSQPFLNGNEWNYLKDCLDTGWISSVGSYVDRFEQDICTFTGSEYAVACVSGTAALHTALDIVGVSSGDQVIVPTVAFIAPVNTVSYVGAEPVFMDCDDFYNIDVAKTLDFIEKETVFKDGYTYNKKTHCRVAALIIVHVFGNAASLEPLIAVCKEKNIKIIEDAAESLGTYYGTGKLTSRHTGTVGDIGCYSFNGNKIITTGGGGMLVTGSCDYAKKARYLTTQARDDTIQYVHNEIGYNYRLTNLQAAIGVAQLEHLSEYIDTKKRNYRIYKAAIDEIRGLDLADVPEYACNNYWMYALQIDKEVYGKDKNQLIAHLVENGIQTRALWYLNHMQKPYKDCQTYNIEKAFDMWEKTLCIPCSVSLDMDDLYYVIRVLRE